MVASAHPGPGGPVEFDVPFHGGVFAPEGIGETFPDDVPVELAMEAVGGDDPAVAFRRTLGMFATGVTVITTELGPQVHGMTANAFMSVSLRPPLVVISVDKRARMHTLLNEGRRFGISVLSELQRDLSDHFAGRVDRPTEAAFEVIHETPVVEGALAHLVCRVVRSYWGGDHSLFVGQVEYARYGEGAPLLFHGGRYELLLASVPVFSSLSPEMLRPILESGEEHRYEAGETIVLEGEPGSELFVILEGEVRIERGGRALKTFSSGEFFGELAVLDGRARSASAVAVTDVRCLTVSRQTLRRALAAEPAAAWAMLEVLAGRLRDE
jgi:flavin reductase (DIM6/NTAB) family NADH-FMN oxidoreductase RutF